MKTPDGAVAWQYRAIALNGIDRTTWQTFELAADRDRRAAGFVEDGYKVETRALIPAASLDALRAERDADRLRYLQMSHERDAILDQLQAAEAKLAAVGALADELESAADLLLRPVYGIDDVYEAIERLRTLIAEAGTGEGGT